MSNFPHRKIRKDLESLRVTSDKLYTLSQHFFAVGNEHVGYKLKDMANDMNDALECIDESVGNWITQDFNAAQEASANMISAMLAVTKENQGERR